MTITPPTTTHPAHLPRAARRFLLLAVLVEAAAILLILALFLATRSPETTP